MEKNLPVPYKSQHDPDSTKSNTDCGPASLAMVLEFFGRKTTTGEILEKLQDFDFINFSQLAEVAQEWGFNVESKVDATFQDIKKYIDRGIPVIVCGGYSYMNSRQDTNFKASHIMVVDGYRPDDSVYANDPDFWGEYRAQGDHHVYTFEEFNNYWRNEGNKEGNQPNILFAVFPKDDFPESLEFPKKVIVTSTQSLRARTSPNINDTNIIKSYVKSTELEVLNAIRGDNVVGNDIWYLVKDSPNLYIWSGATEAIIEEETPQDPPKVEDSVEEKPQDSQLEEKTIENVIAVKDDDIAALQAIYRLTHDYLESRNALPDLLPVTQTKTSFWNKLAAAFHLK